jgi:hypothetical protein
MKQTEHHIQSAYFHAISYHPEWKWIHATPNGGKRNYVVAAKLKGEGVKSGVWDVHIPYPRHGAPGAYIEFKAPKGKLTENQTQFRDDLAKEGYRFFVCTDAAEAYRITKIYMEGAF